MSKKLSEQSDHHIPSEGEYLVAGLSAGHNLQFHESHTKALLEFMMICQVEPVLGYKTCLRMTIGDVK